MTTSQPRQPKGQPVGGQFAGKHQSSDEVSSLSAESTMTVDKYGAKEWCNSDDQRHRTDGPAVEYASGRKEWWVNGQPHRTDGPAIEYADGTKAWWVNGHESSPGALDELEAGRACETCSNALDHGCPNCEEHCFDCVEFSTVEVGDYEAQSVESYGLETLDRQSTHVLVDGEGNEIIEFSATGLSSAGFERYVERLVNELDNKNLQT